MKPISHIVIASTVGTECAIACTYIRVYYNAVIVCKLWLFGELHDKRFSWAINSSEKEASAHSVLQ